MAAVVVSFVQLGVVRVKGLLTDGRISWVRCCPYRCCECVCWALALTSRLIGNCTDLNSGFIGFPSVGKSTLMSRLTGQHSEG